MSLQAHTPKSAARILQVSERKIYELIGTGELASIKIGRSRRITDRQLGEFLEKCEAATEPHAA